MIHKLIAACALLTIVSGIAAPRASAATPTPKYKISDTVPLGSPDRWDYVVFDGASKRVYIAHGTEVSVVDSQDHRLIGHIGPVAGSTHGIAISDGVGFTDDGEAGTAIPFDLATLKMGKPIPTASDADGIVADPASGHVMVINGDSGSVTVLDPAKLAAIATIKIGEKLEFGVADGRGNFFVNGAGNHDIVRIDTKTNAVIAHFPIPACERPHGLAMDRITRRLFATCVNKTMVVVDADNGRNVAILPIGAGSDAAAFDPVRKLAFSSNWDGTLSVIQEKDANTFVALPAVKTVRSARTLAIDPQTSRVFLAAASIQKIAEPTSQGGKAQITYVPGSLKLFVLARVP